MISEQGHHPKRLERDEGAERKSSEERAPPEQVPVEAGERKDDEVHRH